MSLVTLQRERRLDVFAAALLTLIHLGALWLRVGPILRHPTEYMLDYYGDGIKTYYVLLYYVQHDHGLWFTGMNYPFGDHIGYTDDFTPLGWVLRGWKNLFGISDQGIIGALNLTVLLSSIPATPLLYAILRRCLVGQWWAGGTALVIALLAPQFNRLAAHMTLALPFVVPLVWYLQIRLIEVLDAPGGRRWRAVAGWLTGYIIVAVVLGVTHPYYLLHTLLLPAVTGGVRLLQAGRRWRPALTSWAWLLAAGIIPMIMFRLWIAATDPVTDRPETPYGFFVFHANMASVFAPWISPFAEAWRFVFKFEEAIPEGWSYVGVAVDLIIVFFLLRAFDYLRRGRPGLIFRPVLPPPLRATLWASVPILLLAMCWPFAYGFPQPLEWLPALKQFRSLGRLAWVFYYVAAVWAATVYYQLYRYLRARRAGRFGFRLLTLVLVVWALEAKFQLERLTRPLLTFPPAATFVGSDPRQAYPALLAQAGRTAQDFQAVLPVPCYAIGSDKIGSVPDGVALCEGFRAALHTSLPLVPAMLTRTSIGNTLQLVQLLSSDLIAKTLPGRFPNRKPLLLLVSKQVTPRPGEAALIARARFLTETPDARLYELPLSAFATDRPARERAWFTAHRDSLPQTLTASGRVWRSRPGPGVVWQTFPQNEPVGSPARWPGFTRPGVAQYSSDEFRPLYNSVLPQPATVDTTWYELSFWAYTKAPGQMPSYEFRQWAPDGHQVKLQTSATATEISGAWVRTAFYFHLTNPGNRVELRVSGQDQVLDDLLIRPRATHVYWLAADGTPVRDGYPLRD